LAHPVYVYVCVLRKDIALLVIFMCRFEAQVDLPHVPDMIFAENCLRLMHEHGFGIEFTTLDALKHVGLEEDIVQVADAKAWKEARSVSCTFDFVFKIDLSVIIMTLVRTASARMQH